MAVPLPSTHERHVRCPPSGGQFKNAPLLPSAHAQVNGTPLPTLKRQPKGPRTEGIMLENVTMESITAVPYDILKVRRNGHKPGSGGGGGVPLLGRPWQTTVDVRPPAPPKRAAPTFLTCRLYFNSGPQCHFHSQSCFHPPLHVLPCRRACCECERCSTGCMTPRHAPAAAAAVSSAAAGTALLAMHRCNPLARLRGQRGKRAEAGQQAPVFGGRTAEAACVGIPLGAPARFSKHPAMQRWCREPGLC